MSNNAYPEYQDRIVVFLDILGWKDLIAQTQNDQLIVDSLTDMLDGASHLQELIKQAKAGKKPIPFETEVAYFSDTIVISSRYDPNDPSWIDDIFSDAVTRSNSFLEPNLHLSSSSLRQSGLLCRGAIVRGKLFHRDNILFGPALVEAYEMEHNVAVYPRILVSEELVKAHSNAPEPETIVKRDSNGLSFLDAFSPDFQIFGRDETANEWVRIRAGKFRESIANGLDLNKSDTTKLMKWAWMANEFNEAINGRNGIGVKPIQLPTTTVSAA